MKESDIRARLDAERQSTMARIGAKAGDVEGMVAAASGANIDDEHDPEGSTIAYGRASAGALLSQAWAYLDELDRASERLDAGLYPTCERCSASMGFERQAAMAGGFEPAWPARPRRSQIPG